MTGNFDLQESLKHYQELCGGDSIYTHTYTVEPMGFIELLEITFIFKESWHRYEVTIEIDLLRWSDEFIHERLKAMGESARNYLRRVVEYYAQ